MAGIVARVIPRVTCLSRTVLRLPHARQLSSSFLAIDNKTSRLGDNRRYLSFTSTRLAQFQADQELTEFLREEIKLEQQNQYIQSDLPAVQGFTLEGASGPEVTFSKKAGNETIRVQFNINNSIDEDVNFDSTTGKETDPEMIARPPFTVEMDKGTGDVLMLQCMFPQAPEESQEQEQFDLLEISEVAMMKKGSEWSDKVYTAQGSVLDGNLYDMLLNMLEDRGVTMETLQQLINFATAYEHKEYLKFLEGLNGFVSS